METEGEEAVDIDVDDAKVNDDYHWERQQQIEEAYAATKTLPN